VRTAIEGVISKPDIWNIVNVSCGATEPCLFQRDRGKCKNNTIMFAEKVQSQRKCPTKTRIQIELHEESFNGLMKCVNRRLIASNNASFGLEFRKISSFVPPDNFSVSINRSLRSHLDTLNTYIVVLQLRQQLCYRIFRARGFSKRLSLFR
jgi:hypothetical protein